MNLFEKQQKPFAIKLSDRVKDEIKKEFRTDWYSFNSEKSYFHYPNIKNGEGFKQGEHAISVVTNGYTLITEAEFFGDGKNKLRKKIKELNCKGCDIAYCEEKCTMFSELELDKHEQITDDFADKFFDWANVNAYKYPTKTTTAELRQIFKENHYE